MKENRGMSPMFIWEKKSNSVPFVLLAAAND